MAEGNNASNTQKKRRSGQATQFVLVSLVITIIVGLTMLWSSEIIKVKLRSSAVTGMAAEAAPIKFFAEECLRQTAAEQAFALGRQGGYHTLPRETFAEKGYSIPYYYDSGTLRVPTPDQLEAELKAAIEEGLAGCLTFDQFLDEGFVVAMDDPEVTVDIVMDRFVTTLDTPIHAQFGTKSFTIEAVDAVSEIRYGHVHDVAGQLAQKVVESPDTYDYTFFLNQDVTVSVVPLNGTHDIYSIEDAQSMKQEHARFAWLFAARRVVS